MRVLLASDIHSNWDALQVVLRFQRQQRIEVIWLAGDQVGYGAAPLEVLHKLRELGDRVQWVCGNHEELLSSYAAREVRVDSKEDAWQQAPQLAQGRWQEHEDLPRVRPEAAMAMLLHLLEIVGSDDMKWYLEQVRQKFNHSLDSRYSLDVHTGVRLVHGAPDPLNGYLYPWSPDFLRTQILTKLKESVAQGQRTCTIFGHTHIPTLLRENAQGNLENIDLVYGQPFSLGEGVAMINPGSVGFPGDRDARASWAVLDLDNWAVTFYRAVYNIDRAISRMAEKGYPFSLIKQVKEAPLRVNEQSIHRSWIQEYENRSTLSGGWNV